MRAELLDNPVKRMPQSFRFTGELREAFRARGIDLADSEAVAGLIDRGLGPISGGATGMDGAAFMHNLPPEGTFEMNSDLFFAQTERNDVPQGQVAFPGLGGAPFDVRLSNVGVLASIKIIFEGSLVVAGGGTCTATYQWPWNTMKRFSLSANGQTSLLSAEGMDLRARNQRIYRNPRDPMTTATQTDGVFGDPQAGVIANGTYPIQLIYEVPIIHDWYTLTGALFAQSDQIYLGWRFTPAATAELFTLTGGSTATLTGTVKSTTTFFDVPYADVQGGRKVLIPDLQWLHGFVGSDLPFANTGDVKAPFIRTSGELLAYYSYLDNGGAAVIDPTALSEIRFEYGGNRKPRVHNPPTTLLDKNVKDYNGRILPKAGYSVFDFESDNPSRDLVFPKGVTELQTVFGIPAGTTINANAHVHFVEEALFAGR
ncbi:MAG TPA: hypothetical protein VFI17_03485 [Solirubrobacterales bacterium]|nr:hypothetical protein [Solirubrobacterales bacterium]